MSVDLPSQGIRLDSNLPFNITSSNTIIIINCSVRCHDYIRENAIAKAACGITPICCWFTTGGSLNEYSIRVLQDRCSAYQSFVNLDLESPVSKWPEPGLELEWLLPQEPVCESAVDCHSICSALAAGAMPLGITVTVLVYKNSSRRKGELGQESLSKVERIINVSSSGLMRRIFTCKKITRATNNFSRGNLLGFGGFGEVFKGILHDGTIAAIMRAKGGNTKGIDQILNDVRILFQVNHRCLVKLLGGWVELEQPLLVYEYIPNGTLFDHLHKTGGFDGKRAPLTWQGFAYLHSSATPPIYRRDIKSSNILLDNDLNAEVSDFGLPRLAVTDTSHITTCAQGTLGYLDPEYYLNFQLTDKSDVYSFVVMLLELLTSKKALDFNRLDEDVNLAVYGRKILKEERLLDAIDPLLKEGASKLELDTMKALGSLAAACLDEKRQNRPSMKEAADAIEYLISVPTADQVSDSTRQIITG
ncbi:hypothetical protein P3X46_008884 [Hevea brasiliensis]|uniref:Protein kinase domain-containing protein n=1 Tax=Hevea brasiliensis TaxID=3981 RepID=A0ABQ9MNX4_HEVBR|nr:hypothetical protein P3X46_008884 [Hevea brasiliensis]